MRRKVWSYGALLAVGWVVLVVFGTEPRQPLPVPPGGAVLDLRLSAKAYVQLRSLLEQARRTGERAPGGWVGGTLHTDEGAARCRVRLRGDAEAHWVREKFSLRVKLRDDRTYRGCGEFNLIVPADRWLYSELWTEWWNRRLGLVTCATDLVWLRVNGRSLGYYAFVEELGPEQLERQGLPAAPVFKGNRRGHTDLDHYPWRPSVIYSLPFYDSKLPDAPEQQAVAHLFSRLLREMRETRGALSPERYRRLAHLLDLERWAAYAAVCRILGPHSEAPHNVTVYFNAATGLFEPVLLDAFFHPDHEALAEDALDRAYGNTFNVFNRELLSAPAFFGLRLEALRQVVAARSAALQRYGEFARWIPYLAQDPLLEPHIPSWPHDPRQRVSALATAGEAFLGAYGARFATVERYLAGSPQAAPIAYREHSTALPTAHLEVTARGGRRATVALRGDPGPHERLRLTELTIAGAGADAVQVSPAPERRVAEDRRLTLSWSAGPAVGPTEERALTLEGFDPIAHQLAGRVVAGDEEARVFVAVADARRMALDFLDRPVDEVIRAASDLAFRLEPARIVVPAGEYVVRAPLVLPRERRLVLEAGVTIRFAPRASLISYAPLTVAGTPAAPVVLDALDPAQGWGVLAVLATNARAAVDEAPRRSEVRHLVYARSRGATLNGIHYTGGLSFFYSDVTVERSVFVAAGEDDALNVKRAEVALRDCLFYASPSDAIDLDVCGGEVRGCLIVAPGGDGVDLSGAEALTVADTVVIGAADKGVSVGEASRAAVEGNLLAGCLTGIASKDRSRTASRGNALIGCDHAWRAYQKKPIFGPAHVESRGDLLAACAVRDATDAGSTVEVAGLRRAAADGLAAAAAAPARARAAGAPPEQVRQAALRLLDALRAVGAGPASAWTEAGDRWALSAEAWAWIR